MYAINTPTEQSNQDVNMYQDVDNNDREKQIVPEHNYTEHTSKDKTVEEYTQYVEHIHKVRYATMD